MNEDVSDVSGLSVFFPSPPSPPVSHAQPVAPVAARPPVRMDNLARVPSGPWPTEHLPPFLSLAELAALLRISEKAARNLVDRNQVPGVKRPRGWGRVLLKTADVLSWLESSASSSRRT